MRLGLWMPSWNRARFANRLLAQVADQLTPDVQATLSLNPPADGYEIPAGIEVIRNATNIGGDANIDNGLTVMQTDYLWIIGDDEQLLPGAVDEVLDLTAQDPGMIVCTDGRFDHGPTGSFDSWVEWMDACVSAGRGVMLTAQTLVSSTVFRRAGVDLDEVARKADSSFGRHFGMLAGLMWEPVVVTRQPVFIAGRCSDSSIYAATAAEQAAHMARVPASLRHLIEWVNARADRDYPETCYQAGVGFDN